MIVFLIELALTSYRSVRLQRVQLGIYSDELLPQPAPQSGKVTAHSVRRAELSLDRDGPTVRQNGNVPQVENYGGIEQCRGERERHGRAIAIERRTAHQPVASQHPDDLSHTHDPRGIMLSGLAVMRDGS